MNTYDDLVNDYLRAVEQALSGVPAGRREELLADLSQHIAAKRAELSPETEVEVRSILELLGDPSDVAAEAMLDNDPLPPPAPIQIQPGKKLGALAWVLLTVAAVSTLCVVTVLAGVLFFASSDSTGEGTPATPQIQQPTMQPPSSPLLPTPPPPSKS
ncbi:DUF1700 domain-containing protein [Dactylosporangium sp. AC04546]|uniref:DUF1700 domain-containing protein n=1 Tax=Dactylosporangium sp. AC04546 TaxID=2862460 RepID=UPI001EDE7497|nr:DUF1700 domain-containing protein [Dactylosporangium sp. AC04546]WVK83611.1 DUF1700 domain-containing protein [Dactylosporangium sp. AC04546]